MPDGHDPGGKVRTLMPSGMEGGASFHGPGDCYRTTLWRSWGRTGERFVFLGMNPSTAGARHNDPTITRECGFAMRDGASGLWKLNVSAYRATRPADLLKATVPLDCPENRAAILSLTQAPKFIVAFGCLPPVLRPIGGFQDDWARGMSLLSTMERFPGSLMTIMDGAQPASTNALARSMPQPVA